jgi:hypothetical protein
MIVNENGIVKENPRAKGMEDPKAKLLDKPKEIRRKTVYALWAHFMTNFCAVLLVQQAAVAVFGPRNTEAYAILAASCSILLTIGMLTIERVTQRTRKVDRAGALDSEILARVLRAEQPWPTALRTFLTYFQNYAVRGLAYLLLTAPLFLCLSTVLSATCMVVCSCVYFLAYLRGEKGEPVTGMPTDAAPVARQRRSPLACCC